MSSPFPNGFSGADTRNVSFPMDSSFRRSMLITSNQTNHHGLFSSSSPLINHFQNSHVSSSSSFGFSNPLVPNYQMRNNMVSNVIDYSPMNNNPHLSRVSITQTITNRYSAIVPTSILITSQNEYDRGLNPTILNPSFYSQNLVDNQREIFNSSTPRNFVDTQRENLNPTPRSFVDTQREILNPTPRSFVDHQREILSPTPRNFVDNQREILNSTPRNFVDNQPEILNPTPLNTFLPHQNFVFPRHGDHSAFSPEHHLDQHVPQRRPVKKRSRPTKHFDGTFDDFDFEEDGEYDGRTHSLPYEKYGPYTCPKCESVFDTSQKFAAHISSVHYKNETIEERARRYKAKNKNKLRKLNETFNGESLEVPPENTVVEENVGNNNIASEEDNEGNNNNIASETEEDDRGDNNIASEEDNGGNNNIASEEDNGGDNNIASEEDNDGGNNNIASETETEASQLQLVVKEEPSCGFV